jgi:Yip1-like protein
MDVVARAKNILVTPKTEWQVIQAEPTSVEDIYRDYLVYIAAVPAIAGFIGSSLVGQTLPIIGVIRIPVIAGLFSAVLSFVLALAGVYLLALIIDRLAPTFEGVPSFLNAFKLSAYSATPAWLAGIFAIIPSLGALAIVGLYSLYLLYVGLPILMRTRPEKSLGYVIAVMVAAIVIYLLIGLIMGVLVGGLVGTI